MFMWHSRDSCKQLELENRKLSIFLHKDSWHFDLHYWNKHAQSWKLFTCDKSMQAIPGFYSGLLHSQFSLIWHDIWHDLWVILGKGWGINLLFFCDFLFTKFINCNISKPSRLNNDSTWRTPVIWEKLKTKIWSLIKCCRFVLYPPFFGLKITVLVNRIMKYSWRVLVVSKTFSWWCRTA